MLKRYFSGSEAQELGMTNKPHNRSHNEIISMIADDLEELYFLRGEVRALKQRLGLAEDKLLKFEFSHYGTNKKRYYVLKE